MWLRLNKLMMLEMHPQLLTAAAAATVAAGIMLLLQQSLHGMEMMVVLLSLQCLWVGSCLLAMLATRARSYAPATPAASALLLPAAAKAEQQRAGLTAAAREAL
jgi:hypothetical protein